MSRSNERPHQDDRFPNNYTLPSNQLTAELELRDTYKRLFPDENSLMVDLLADIQRFAGMGVPKYTIAPSQSEDAEMAGIADEQGFITMTNSPAMTAVRLRTRDMLEHERDQPWDIYDGKMPPATRMLLDEVYGLTGASIVSDTTSQVGSKLLGMVMRQGTYQDVPIYIRETRQSAHSFGKHTVFTAHLFNQRWAMLSLEIFGHSAPVAGATIEPKRFLDL